MTLCQLASLLILVFHLVCPHMHSLHHELFKSELNHVWIIGWWNSEQGGQTVVFCSKRNFTRQCCRGLHSWRWLPESLYEMFNYPIRGWMISMLYSTHARHNFPSDSPAWGVMVQQHIHIGHSGQDVQDLPSLQWLFLIQTAKQDSFLGFHQCILSIPTLQNDILECSTWSVVLGNSKIVGSGVKQLLCILLGLLKLSSHIGQLTAKVGHICWKFKSAGRWPVRCQSVRY